MLGLANPGIMFLGSGCQCSTLIILDHGENMQIKPTFVKLVFDMKISESSRIKRVIESKIAFD